jgi:hypothetical protein
VRAKLGKPVLYVRSGNTVVIVSNANQKDISSVGSNFVIVFYDVLAGSKVISLMIVPKTDETKAMTPQKALFQFDSSLPEDKRRSYQCCQSEERTQESQDEHAGHQTSCFTQYRYAKQELLRSLNVGGAEPIRSSEENWH